MFAASSTDPSSTSMHSLSDGLDFLNALSPVPDEQGQTFEPEAPVAMPERVDESGENAVNVNLSISNVVCMANMRCHLYLKDIARRGIDVEYKAAKNVSSSISRLTSFVYPRLK